MKKSVTVPRRKMPPGPGRPRGPVPQDAATVIDELASRGYSMAHIGRTLGTDKTTFREWMERDPVLQAAFDNGRERERLTLHNALYQRAVDMKNPLGAASAMFLLKSRHGYREGDSGESGNKVNVTFNLPGARKLPEPLTIENEDGKPQPLALSKPRS